MYTLRTHLVYVAEPSDPSFIQRNRRVFEPERPQLLTGLKTANMAATELQLHH